MPDYDFIISASCYLSPQNTIRMLKSIPIIKARVLPIITCPRVEDAWTIMAYARKASFPIIILHSRLSSRYFCQSIAFVYCVAHQIKGKYFGIVDDDIEFIDGDLLSHINACASFSTFAFSSNQIVYGFSFMTGTYVYGEYHEDPPWLDAHNLFSRWEDNLAAGLPDCTTGVDNAAFVDIEYQHRLHLLTGKPPVGCTYQPILHHTRIDSMEASRGNRNIVIDGYRLWTEKFGLALDGAMMGSGMNFGWHDVYNVLCQEHFAPLYRRHLIFGGLWTDWDAIWQKYGQEITVAHEVLMKKANNEIVDHSPFTGKALKLGLSQGYLYPWEVLAIQVFAHALPQNAVVINIGAGAGTSGLAMAEARLDLIKNIYTIDVAEDNRILGLVAERNSFSKYHVPLVNQIHDDSYNVGMCWDKGPVDMVFVDGDHSVYAVERDIQAWLPHIKDGGFMLFHDYNHAMYSGLKPAVDRLMVDHEQLMVVDLLAVYRIRKTDPKIEEGKNDYNH